VVGLLRVKITKKLAKHQRQLAVLSLEWICILGIAWIRGKRGIFYGNIQRYILFSTLRKNEEEITGDKTKIDGMREKFINLKELEPIQ